MCDGYIGCSLAFDLETVPGQCCGSEPSANSNATDLSKSPPWLNLTLNCLLFQGLMGNPGEHGLKGDKVI